MTSLQRLLVLTTLVAAVAALAARAQAVPVIEALYLQSDVLPGASLLPGFDPADTVRSNGQREIHATPTGNFVGPVNTDPSQGNTIAAGTFYLFGSTDGGNTPVALRREATLGGQQQIVFGSAGIDNTGQVSYAASVPNPGSGPTRLSSLWENDAVVWIQGDAIPAGALAGQHHGTASGVYRSPTGVTSWVTSYTSTTLGPRAGTALLRGVSSYEVLLQSGDVIPDLGAIATDPDSSTISANIEWSQSGTTYITEVDLEIGFTDTDEAPIINGSALFTPSGALIREGAAIPAADGGLAGEIWDIFGLYDVNDAGEFVMSAFTDGVPDDQESILVFNGAVLHREGDIVDGVPLLGQVQGVGINDLGDIAFAWNDTLFINDQKIGGPGTLVDTDGDGLVDAPIDGTGLSLGLLEITNQPAAGGDGLPVVYFAGEVGGGRDTYFRLVPEAKLPGDFNNDGAVDASDYATWREGLGTTFAPADFDAWLANYGAKRSPAPSTSTPEPSAAALAWLIVAATCRRATRRSRSS